MTGSKTSMARGCKKMEADLVLFHYGKYGETERPRIESHLSRCAACRIFLEEIAALPGPAQRVNLPPSFWADYSMELKRKLNAVDKSRSPARALWFLPAWPVPALGAAMVAILALSFVLARGLWRSEPSVSEEARILEVAPLVQDMEFFRAMPYLEAMEQDENSSRERSTRLV